MIKKIWMSFLVFILCLVSISALSIPKQDSCIYVYDYADVISDQTKQSLISMNQSSDYSTGGYVVIATFDFVEGDLYDYAYKLFNKWGIGDDKNNNGVLLLLDIGNENCAWIIGTGLENVLSDGRCQSIIDNYFKEDFLNKKYDKAVLNTTKQFLKHIENGNFKVVDNKSHFFGIETGDILTIGIVLFFIILAIIISFISPNRGRSYQSRRRYHRPHYHRPRSYSHRPMSGSRSFSRYTSRSSRPSRGSSSSRTSGTHHSGGRSRGSGGTLK